MLFGRLNTKIQNRQRLFLNENGVTIEAGGFNTMLTRVQAYRLEHGGDLAPGWRHRLGTAIVEQNPEATDICSVPEEMAHYPMEPTTLDVFNFLGVMIKWFRSGRRLVDGSEASRRADICRECPYNVTMSGCDTCRKVSEKVRSVIESASPDNMELVKDSSLKVCGRCGCQLNAKIWLPASVIVGSSTLPLPSHCWMLSPEPSSAQ